VHISLIIYREKRSFKYTSNPSVLIFVRSLPPLQTQRRGERVMVSQRRGDIASRRGDTAKIRGEASGRRRGRRRRRRRRKGYAENKQREKEAEG